MRVFLRTAFTFSRSTSMLINKYLLNFILLIWLFTAVHSKKCSAVSKVANLFRNAIDKTVKPCDDFYNFACGKWLSTAKEPKEEEGEHYFKQIAGDIDLAIKDLLLDDKPSSSVAINKTKKLFAKCMDLETLKKKNSSTLLKRIEEDFTYWPILHGDKWSPRKFDLSAALSKASVVSNPFFVMEPFDNKQKPGGHLLRFLQADLNLDKREYYLNETHAEKLNAYKEYMIKKIAMMVEDAGLNRTKEEIVKEVKSIIEFEKRLANITIVDSVTPDNNQSLYQYKVSELPTISDKFEWSRYIRLLSPKVMSAYVESDPVVLLYHKDFFERLKHLLTETDVRTVANYIIWTYTEFWGSLPDERFEKLHRDLMTSLEMPEENSSRYKRCLGNLFYANNIAGALYVRTYLPKSKRKTALVISNDVLNAFKHVLKASDWMDDVTKERILKKLNKMEVNIGGGDYFYNDQLLDETFSFLTENVNTDDDFGTITLQLINASLRKILLQIVNPNNSQLFFNNPASDYFSYEPSKQTMDLGASLFRFPYFDTSFPATLNYASIGELFGDDVSRVLGTSNITYNENGVEEMWWSNATHENFLKHVHCIVEQYSNNTAYGTLGLNVTEEHSRELIIAQLGGTKSTYHAYQQAMQRSDNEAPIPGLKEYTNEQLFFIYHTLLRCRKYPSEVESGFLRTSAPFPPRTGVNGCMANTPQFAKAFNCPVDSPMNPSKKCHIW